MVFTARFCPERSIMSNYPGLKSYLMGERLVEAEMEEVLRSGGDRLFLTPSRKMQEVLQMAHINFEGDVRLQEVEFTKIEAQQECLWGSLYIPSLVDVTGTKYRILFFINERHIVIVDDYAFSERMIGRIQSRRIHQADSIEKFLCNFLSEIIGRDPVSLTNYEKSLRALEERIRQNKTEDFRQAMAPLRSDLLILQEYYAELSDLGRELEEDENGFFAPEQRKFFGVVSDRADRLMNKSGQLLEYAKQIKEDCQTAISARQNSTMQFLTIISTIFMPLTLITSWYGMNFTNMPELEGGYPFVIILSICVIVITLIIFWKKKLL